MEYKVGSLANLISGIKSSGTSKNVKLFKNVVNEDTGIKFETVKKSKKKDLKRKAIENTSPLKQKKVKKHGHKTETDAVEPEAETSNGTFAVKRIERKRQKEIVLQNQDVINKHESRSIFVGNVPNTVGPGKIKKLFKKYGQVEAVRLRSAPLADPRVPKKVAVIKKKFHPDRSSIHAYVRFADEESAKKALAVNGRLFGDHHLQVDMASKTDGHDSKKAVFLGNVPFSAEEDELWKMFESCGKIVNIRIVRDKRTGVGKGFAYINFETSDAVELALKLNGEVLKKREIRVERCVKKARKKLRNKNKPNPKKRKSESLETNKESNEDSMTVEEQDDHDFAKPPKKNKTQTDSEHKISGFEGQKVAEKKKKKKKNKSELKKIAMRNKVLPKSKLAPLKVKKSAKKPKSLAKKMKFKPSVQ